MNRLAKRAAPGTTPVPGYVFGGIGLALCSWGLVLLADRAAMLLRWTEADAVVVSSRIETTGAQHAARIRARYQAGDETIEAEPAHDHRGSYSVAAEAVDRYRPGAQAPVLYDPRDPERARLGAGWNLETFFSGLLLVVAGAVFGGVGVLALWTARRRQAALAAGTTDQRRADRGEVLAVGGFVFAIGLAFVASALAVAPAAFEALDWPVVSAKVERSDVFARTSRGRSAKTVYVARLYVGYDFERRHYTSTLEAGSSRDRASVDQLLASIPPGAPRPVRVNPQHPHRIEAEGSWPLLLPGIFLVVGLAVSGAAVAVMRLGARAKR